MSKHKRNYKYRRLKCGHTSTQCGGVCIRKEDTCHKGKAALLKANVKKDVSRLENGGDFGKVSEKALTKILVQDKDIGQKMPAGFGLIVANSEKLDDRVKKAYIDSATKSKWNYKGKASDVKLKKEDSAFRRKISNRSITHNVTEEPEKERDEKKERKSFFKTVGGQDVLKAIAAAALVGGVAAVGTYTLSTAKKTEDPKEDKRKVFGIDENESDAVIESRKSWKTDVNRLERIENTAEAVRRGGDETSARIISEKNLYDNPQTSYETYSDVYKSAQKLESMRKKNAFGNNDRKIADYESMWGFKPEDADKHLHVNSSINLGVKLPVGSKVRDKKGNSVNILVPTKESTLGLARKRVIDDLNSQGFTTEKEHQDVLIYHENPKNWDNIRKTGKKYDPESNRYVLRKWTDTYEQKDEFEPKKVGYSDKDIDLKGVKDASYGKNQYNKSTASQWDPNKIKREEIDGEISVRYESTVNEEMDIEHDMSNKSKKKRKIDPNLSRTFEKEPVGQITDWDSRDPEIKRAKEERERYLRNEEELSPFGMQQDELQRARAPYSSMRTKTEDTEIAQRLGKGTSHGKWEDPEGSSYLDEEWAQKGSPPENKESTFLPVSGAVQLSDGQKNKQRKDWRALDRDKREMINDIDLLRQVSKIDYGDNYDDIDAVRKKLKDLYITNRTYSDAHLEAMRENNMRKIEEDIISGNAVLPQYRSQAQESENAQKTGGGYSSSTGGEIDEYGGLENVATQENHVPRTQLEQDVQDARSKGMSKRVIEERKYDISRDVKPGEKPPWKDNELEDSSGRKMRRKKRRDGKGFIYFWNNEFVPRTVKNDAEFVRWLKDGGKWNFAEELLEETVYEIIEEKNGILVCTTDEGLIAYDFNNKNNYTKVYL